MAIEAAKKIANSPNSSHGIQMPQQIMIRIRDQEIRILVPTLCSDGANVICVLSKFPSDIQEFRMWDFSVLMNSLVPAVQIVYTRKIKTLSQTVLAFGRGSVFGVYTKIQGRPYIFIKYLYYTKYYKSTKMYIEIVYTFFAQTFYFAWCQFVFPLFC